MILKVSVSNELILSFFQEGSCFDGKYNVSGGVPAGSRLIGISKDIEKVGVTVFLFESCKALEDSHTIVELKPIIERQPSTPDEVSSLPHPDNVPWR